MTIWRSAFLTALLVAGCGGMAVAPSSSAAVRDTPVPADATPAPAAESTPEPAETPEPVDTPEPTPDGPGQFKAGETVLVTQNGEDWAEINITNVKQVKRYNGPYDLDDVPAKGNIYIEMKVWYVAIADGVDYNPFDWQVFVAGNAVDSYAYVSNGPEPDLGSGTLPKGRKASGYLVFEVPIKGEVLMSYGGGYGDPPVFEIQVRAK